MKVNLSKGSARPLLSINREFSAPVRVRRDLDSALLGRLQPLVDIEGVENIDIVGYDNVWLTFAGGNRQKYPHPVSISDDELEREINFIATRRGEGASTANCADLARLPGQVTISPVWLRQSLAGCELASARWSMRSSNSTRLERGYDAESPPVAVRKR